MDAYGSSPSMTIQSAMMLIFSHLLAFYRHLLTFFFLLLKKLGAPAQVFFVGVLSRTPKRRRVDLCTKNRLPMPGFPLSRQPDLCQA